MPLLPLSPDITWAEKYYRSGVLTSREYNLDGFSSRPSQSPYMAADRSAVSDDLVSSLPPSLSRSSTSSSATASTESNVSLKLNQNESAYPWPTGLKDEVLNELSTLPWHVYTPPYSFDLEHRLAEYLDVERGCVLLASGSNQILEILFHHLQVSRGSSWVLLRPSFVYYEECIRFGDLDVKTWPLTKDTFEYSLATLPDLKEGSVVLFATPNNPTGSSISSSDLRSLLQAHPKVLFICDEAYFEFSDDQHLSLLGEFSNMIILRTFSKAFASAGIRIGYMIGAPFYVAQIRKLLRPFSLNHFSRASLTALLSRPDMLKQLKTQIRSTVVQKDRLRKQLVALAAQVNPEERFFIPDSSANFLLMLWERLGPCEKVYRSLRDRGILLRHLSGAPYLSPGAMRMTVGTEKQNRRVMDALSEIYALSRPYS